MRLVIQKSGRYRYVSFRESFWDKSRKKHSSRTVKNFGRLDLLQEKNPNVLEELRREVEEHNLQKEAEKKLLVEARFEHAKEEALLRQDAEADNRSFMPGAAPLRQIWERLQLPSKLRDWEGAAKKDYDFAEAGFTQVAARSLMPHADFEEWERRNTCFVGCRKLDRGEREEVLEKLLANQDELMAFLSRQIDKECDRDLAGGASLRKILDAASADDLGDLSHTTEGRVSRLGGRDLIDRLALLMCRLLENKVADAGENLPSERLREALADAEVVETVMPGGETLYIKTRTKGDFERIGLALGLGVLPRLASAADVKRVLKWKDW